jgi:hypothetical protein
MKTVPAEFDGQSICRVVDEAAGVRWQKLKRQNNGIVLNARSHTVQNLPLAEC